MFHSRIQTWHCATGGWGVPPHHLPLAPLPGAVAHTFPPRTATPTVVRAHGAHRGCPGTRAAPHLPPPPRRLPRACPPCSSVAGDMTVLVWQHYRATRAYTRNQHFPISTSTPPALLGTFDFVVRFVFAGTCTPSSAVHAMQEASLFTLPATFTSHISPAIFHFCYYLAVPLPYTTAFQHHLYLTLLLHANLYLSVAFH